MKIENVVIGLLVLMFASILFGDAVLTTSNPAGMILSPNDVKGIAGFTFILTAILIFIKQGNKTENPFLFLFCSSRFSR